MLKMGNIQGIFCRRKRQIRLLFQGLNAAGKTTILYHLATGETVASIPTVGFNVETIERKEISIMAWDVGGGNKIRPLIRHYYPNTDVLVFVIDSTDEEQMNDIKEELKEATEEDELRRSIILVLANKQDIEGALTADEVGKKLEVSKYKREQGVIPVFPTCATTGEGLKEALDWLESELARGLGSAPKLDSEDSETGYFGKFLMKMKSIFID